MLIELICVPIKTMDTGMEGIWGGVTPYLFLTIMMRILKKIFTNIPLQLLNIILFFHPP